MNLNEENAVLVRAYNNYVPFSKMLNPSCDEMYLKLDHYSDHQRVIQKLYMDYSEKSTGKKIDLWNEEERAKLTDEIKPYLPLTSNYVSTLSFSINGLVSDDINNYFSKYDICVIDPLKYHENENFISFTVNDTTIKGGIKLSDDAILVIKDDTFNKLNEEQKNTLIQNYHVEVFNGSLKKGVEDVLQKYGYPALDIINSRERQYINASPVKESAVSFIKEYAQSHNLSQLRLFDIYSAPTMYETSDILAQEKIADEMEKSEDIRLYYRNNFYEFLVSIAKEEGYEINEVDEYYLMSDFSNSLDVLEELVKYIINKKGFNYYAQIISQYNQGILTNYKTNTEILEELNNDRSL